MTHPGHRQAALTSLFLGGKGISERTQCPLYPESRHVQYNGQCPLNGLALAPAEVGPQLRLQHLDQPIGEFLHVGMAPIYTWAGEPVILVLVNGGAGLILIGQNGSPNSKTSATARFLFVRPRVVAREP